MASDNRAAAKDYYQRLRAAAVSGQPIVFKSNRKYATPEEQAAAKREMMRKWRNEHREQINEYARMRRALATQEKESSTETQNEVQT